MYFSPVPVLCISGAIGGFAAGVFLACWRLRWHWKQIILAALVGASLANVAVMLSGIPPASPGDAAIDFIVVFMTEIAVGIGLAIPATRLALALSRFLAPLLHWRPRSERAAWRMLMVAVPLGVVVNGCLRLLWISDGGEAYRLLVQAGRGCAQGLLAAEVAVLAIYVVHGRPNLWKRIVSWLVLGGLLYGAWIVGGWVVAAYQNPPAFGPRLSARAPILLPFLVVLALLWCNRSVIVRYQVTTSTRGQFRMSHLWAIITLICIAMAELQLPRSSMPVVRWQLVAYVCAIAAAGALLVLVPLAWATLIAPARRGAPAWFCYAVLAMLLRAVSEMLTSELRWPLENWLFSPVPVFAFASYQCVRLLRRMSLVSAAPRSEIPQAAPDRFLRRFALATGPVGIALIIIAAAVAFWRWPFWQEAEAIARLQRAGVSVHGSSDTLLILSSENVSSQTMADLGRLRGNLGVRLRTATDEDLMTLSELDNVVMLVLSGSGSSVTDQGLAAVSRMSQLESLYLDGTAVTDAGVRHLEQLRNLEELCLCSTGVTDASIDTISKMHQLEEVHVLRSHVSPEGAERLQRLCPHLKIE